MKHYQNKNGIEKTANGSRLRKLLMLTLLVCATFSNGLLAQNCKAKASCKGSKETCAMQKAAETGDLGSVKKIVEEKGVDVNKQTADKNTMLTYATWNNQNDVAKYLVSKGADVNLLNKDNNTSFHLAMMQGNYELAKLYLDKGADINQIGQWGFSALHMATYGQKVEKMKFLIDNGADVHVKDSENRTPVFVAAWTGNVNVIELLDKKGADLTVANKNGITILHNLARSGFIYATDYVLARGGNANATDKNGMTPLMFAVMNRHADVVNSLVSKTTAINNQEKNYGNTALHIAAINGDKESAKLLVSAKAKTDIQNNEKQTPVDLAVTYGQYGVMGYFVESNIATKADEEKLKNNIAERNAAVKPGEARVTYAGHSGYIVQTENKVLVFDYWSKGQSETPCLTNGGFCTYEMADKEVYVFASHAHGDHYDTTIYSWNDKVKNIHYVYGFKPEEICKKTTYTGPEYKYIDNNTTASINGVKVTTLKSNDSGQGFLVEVDGVSVYHPGDHAWFSSEDEKVFKKEVDYIESVNSNVDIAFLPVSGCPARWQKDYIKKGFAYNIEQLNPKVVYPMHGFQREASYLEFAEYAKDQKLPTKVVCFENVGDSDMVEDISTASND